ncbi:hypothetical protein [Clostridium sp.]|uniref:hypothetical protein n=1 Tax=Clostridium sp. TaxID=1506 RepID=UPI002046AAD3|nr:hypothetical protein [Clostridium sp.]MDU1033994.1 hypothetical protein [Clostridium sp.]DAV02179.1 MAG TPA: hypothetical protein [Caudoviricetes sp.]
MKAMTVREFIILEFVKEHFDMDCIEVKALGGDEVLVTDFDGASMMFGYDPQKGVIEIE